MASCGRFGQCSDDFYGQYVEKRDVLASIPSAWGMIRVGNYKGYSGLRMMEMLWESTFINVSRRLKYRLCGWINSMHA